ncbi:MAG: pseudomurein-binding repeat-containing protein, partial [Methanobacterium sp.]
ITVGTTTMDLADFLYLATQATVQINSNNNNPITLNDQKLPSPSSEQLTTELLTLASYVDFAQRIVQHMNWNGVAPEYGIATIGKVSYESQIYIYSRILAYYQTNKVLPTNIVVKSWNATNIPTNGINVSFTIDDIANASTNVKNYIENNKRLPNTVKVGDVVMGVAQYLYLATKATIELNNNITSPITVGDFLLPSSSYNEVSSGTITLSNYVDFAQRIAQHMDWNGVAPNYGHVTIDSATGYINYQSMIYIYSRILDFYITNDRLPNSVSTIPWSIVTYSLPAGYEQYLAVTNNCQVDDASIQALSNSITSSKTTLYDKAAAIFNWVRDNIGYSFYYNTKYGAVGTLNARTGNCVDTSHLIIALARAACIPARYEHVYAQFSSGSWYGHVIAQVYVNGQWYNADGTSSRNTFGVISNWNTGTATYYGTYASLPF